MSQFVIPVTNPITAVTDALCALELDFNESSEIPSK